MRDGILIIDKPAGITSHDVVAKVRKQIGTKKVGHTGTLDPMATGVLVVCVGAATKLVEKLTCDKKEYEAKLLLGIQTDTADITGKIISQKEVPLLSELFVAKVFSQFVGKQMQVPPKYSAIKVNGMKLYEYARRGLEVEIKPREIEIEKITFLSMKEHFYTAEMWEALVGKGKGETKQVTQFEKETKNFENQKLVEIAFRVVCSKGTYIRSLCEDIAKKLGTVGTMLELRRLQTGNYSIEDAIQIEEITEEKIIPMEKLFDKKIQLQQDVEKLLNGMELDYLLPDGLYNLYTDHYIGIGRIKNKKLKREIIL